MQRESNLISTIYSKQENLDAYMKNITQRESGRKLHPLVSQDSLTPSDSLHLFLPVSLAR